MKVLDATTLLDLITGVHRDFACGTPPANLYEKLLTCIIGLTGSECGFLGEVSYRDGHVPALNILAEDDWSPAEGRVGYEGPIKDRTPCGWVLDHGEALILNDAGNDPRCIALPACQCTITACIVLPLYVGNEMVGVLGMANRPGGYDQAFAASLAPLLHTTSTLISARKGELYRKSQVELTAAQHLLTDVLDTIPVRVFWKDQESRYLGCNRLFALDAGLQTPEQLIGKTDYEMVWAEQADLYRQDDGEVMASGRPKLNYEKVQTAGDGKKIWLESSKIPLTDSRGKLIGILGVSADITERKQREQVLESLERVSIACLQSTHIDPMLEGVLDIMLDVFRCDRAWLLSPCDPTADFWRVHMERHRPEWPGALALAVGDIPMTPDAAEVFAFGQTTNGVVVFGPASGREVPVSAAQNFSVRSQMCLAIHPRIGKPWLLGIHHCAESQAYTPHEQKLFEEFGRRIADSLGTLLIMNELKRFRAALDNAVDHIFLVDPKRMRFVDVNKAAAQAMGYAREELLSLGPQDVVVGVNSEQLSDLSKNIVASKGMMTKISMHRSKDGREFPVEVHLSALEQEEGEPLILVVARDISERKKAEDALRTSHERYLRLFNALNDAVIICDLEGRIIQVNKKALFLFGYTETELAQMTIKHLHPDYASSICDKSLANVVENGAANFEIDFRKRNGTIFPSVVSARVLDLSGERVIQGIVHDVSNIKRAEEDLHKYKLYLEQLVEQRTLALTNINKELESFGYTMSHDMRSPLREINGYIQALLKDLEKILDDEGRERLIKIQRAARRMGYLVDGLISLSQLQRSDLKRQEVDLAVHAQAVIDQLASEEPERRVRVEIMPQIRAYGDRNLLWVAIDNLLANAWKYTSKKRWAHIEFGVEEQGGERVYYVRDNGIGFGMAQVNRLFGAFQRAPEAEQFEGVGIGLAAVQRIIHLHGGRVWAKSEPNEGAVFYFVLPER